MFRSSKVIIRSVLDKKYPEVDLEAVGGISSWLALEPYDFYRGGLRVILNLRYVVIDEDGNWAYVKESAELRKDTPGVSKAWVLGEIPWRNILEIDPSGDRHYRGPHLYCDFADNGRPYERIVAAELGDYFDRPLDPTKQLPDVTGAFVIRVSDGDEQPIQE